MPDDGPTYRYRSDRGEIRTETDMEAIFADDITGLEIEDRDNVTFESWLAEMIDWGRYSRIYEDDEDDEYCRPVSRTSDGVRKWPPNLAGTRPNSTTSPSPGTAPKPPASQQIVTLPRSGHT
jgi:hypothetical protein